MYIKIKGIIIDAGAIECIITTTTGVLILTKNEKQFTFYNKFLAPKGVELGPNNMLEPSELTKLITGLLDILKPKELVTDISLS